MAGQANRAQPEEWLSIILAVAVTIIAPVAITFVHNWEPEHKIFWTLPLWIGLFYLIFQMAFLLQSASQVRALGVLDSVVAIFPFVVGLVLLALNIVDHSRFPLSSYQNNILAVLIIVGASEFLLTIWIRFVVNRRTIGMSDGN